MGGFHNEAARDTSLVVHPVSHEVASIGARSQIFFAISSDMYELAAKLALNDIIYAAGAGLNSQKLVFMLRARVSTYKSFVCRILILSFWSKSSSGSSILRKVLAVYSGFRDRW